MAFGSRWTSLGCIDPDIKIIKIIIIIIIIIAACLTTDHEVAGSIPGTSTNFKCGLGLERVPPGLMRTIGYLLD